MYQINLALQVLPMGVPKDQAYRIVDEAIRCIAASGLKYEVTAFETVIEGSYDEVMELVETVQKACKKAGATDILINMKLQRSFTKDVFITDKTGKYQ